MLGSRGVMKSCDGSLHSRLGMTRGRQVALLACAGLLSMDAVAAGDAATAKTFGILAVLIVLAKAASLVERFKQPAVLGEIAMGIIVGNLFLLGFDFFEPAKKDPILQFLAEFGVVVLLFQIGLETNVATMMKVGVRALLVAVVGVVAPFVIGVWFVGPVLFPGGSFNTYLFFGATLTATSVGITARVFQDMGKLHSREAQIVLGAAVIDDVIGLIILAIVSAVVKSGTVSLMEVLVITGKAVGFLVGALLAGRYLARFFTGIFIRINTGLGVKLVLAMGTCLMFAYVSSLLGLAPIVGAFAAGLILDEVYFRGFADATLSDDVRVAVKDADASTTQRVGEVLEKHAKHHLETLMAPIGFVFVPLFFIYTGMQVNLTVLNDSHLVLVALGVTFVAFAGKLVSGLVAGPVNKWIVGWGMAPRGEVGLIFAVVGRQLGVVDDEEFAAIIIMVMLTTLLTPLVLAWLIKRQR
jgi:Kef-type K+ transport system membrane component KefB